MIIFPAIDVLDKKIVRLKEGLATEKTVYGDNIPEQARLFDKAGAQYLHIVDLNGAFTGDEKKSQNKEIITAAIQTFSGKVQIGGGIRNRNSIDSWIEKGAARLVIGTSALTQPDLVKEAARDYPKQIVVAVDARDGMVMTQGWAKESSVKASDLALRFEDAGVAAILFTDIGRDGLLKGCNIAATANLAYKVGIPVIASGGVSSLHDIKTLYNHKDSGIEGVITGRAIYDGRLNLGDALKVAAGAL